MGRPQHSSISHLLEQYDTLFLDAYGVLLDRQGALPGAVALIEHLNAAQHPYFLLTNSASRLPQGLSSDLKKLGLDIPPEHIISSGMLLQPLFRERNLDGAQCLVLGPKDSLEYVRMAGGEAVSLQDGVDARVVVLADQKGFELQQGLDITLSMLIGRIERGQKTELLLCNPDLIYPVAQGKYGFTAGALSAMLNHVLEARYPKHAPQFEPLGKPHPPIFEAAAQRARGRILMIGDQLTTDILGARRFGIDSALVLTGLSGWPARDTTITPDYVLSSLNG